jgi:hypothetical protein
MAEHENNKSGGKFYEHVDVTVVVTVLANFQIQIVLDL